MTKVTLRFFCDESAATAIEYALIAGGISIVIIATGQRSIRFCHHCAHKRPYFWPPQVCCRREARD
jgi:hypothetical protein